MQNISRIEYEDVIEIMIEHSGNYLQKKTVERVNTLLMLHYII